MTAKEGPADASPGPEGNRVDRSSRAKPGAVEAGGGDVRVWVSWRAMPP